MKHITFLFFALFYLQLLSAGNDFGWRPIHPAFDRLAVRCEEVNFVDGNRNQLEPVIGRMFQIARNQRNRQLYARACYWCGWRGCYYGDISAKSWSDRALANADSAAYPYDHARIQLLRAAFLRSDDKWVKSYTICKQLVDVWRGYGDWQRLASTYVQMGAIMDDLGDNDLALKYLRLGSENYLRAGNRTCETKNRLNVSNQLYKLGKKDDAMRMLRQLMRDPVALADTGFIVNVMASIYGVSDQKDTTLLRRAYRMSMMERSPHLIALSAINLGTHMMRQRRYSEAVDFFMAALRQSRYVGNATLAPALHELSEAYRHLGRTDSAYVYLMRYEATKDSMASHNKLLIVEKMESLKAIKLHEAEFAKVNAYATMLKCVTAIVIVVSLLVLGFILRLHIIEKRKKSAKEEENRKLVARNLEMLSQLDTKNRELTSNTIIVSERNQALEDLKDDIKTLCRDGKLSGEEENRLLKKINGKLGSPMLWQTFKIHFEEVCPMFFSTLKNRCPSLTERELRLCAYVRIGISTKEIAQMLSVLPETVNTTRYRIRKKIGLGKDCSLEDYLRGLCS